MCYKINIKNNNNSRINIKDPKIKFLDRVKTIKSQAWKLKL